MKTKVQPKVQQPQTPTPSPFGAALRAARAITSRRPHEGQPQELAELREALSKLDEGACRNLVFRLVKEVLEDRARIQALFPVAREARMMGVAFNTAAISRALREGGLTLSDLRLVGLAEIKIGKANKPYVVYHVGLETVKSAAEKLRRAGKKGAAAILSEHLRRYDRNRQLAAAAKAASSWPDEEAEPNAEES